jgi:hypothetical protein
MGHQRLIRISHRTPEDIDRDRTYVSEAKAIEADFCADALSKSCLHFPGGRILPSDKWSS